MAVYLGKWWRKFRIICWWAALPAIPGSTAWPYRQRRRAAVGWNRSRDGGPDMKGRGYFRFAASARTSPWGGWFGNGRRISGRGRSDPALIGAKSPALPEPEPEVTRPSAAPLLKAELRICSYLKFNSFHYHFIIISLSFHYHISQNNS